MTSYELNVSVPYISLVTEFTSYILNFTWIRIILWSMVLDDAETDFIPLVGQCDIFLLCSDLSQYP